MRKRETVAILREQLLAAQQAGPTTDDFRQAQNYYYGRPRGDELPGRSVVQSLDVADMVQAILAQVLPSFTQDAVCQFEPDGPNDDSQARLESDACNKVMMEGNRGYVLFYEALQDALLQKNGIIKGYLEEQDGKRYIRLKAVDPTNFIVGSDTDCVLLYEARFVAERKQYARGELVEMGFSEDKVAEIPLDDWITDESATQARRRAGVTPQQGSDGWANEQVIVWEIYTQLPKQKDSPDTRLYRCLLGGRTLLLQEETEAIPYASGTAFLEPHMFWGLSMFDRLRTVQDEKTAIHRQWLDNLSNCNNSRTVANENINLEDLITGRPGGIIRSKGQAPVTENFSPLPSIDAGPAAQGFLAYMDQVRADRGGAALQMANAEMQTVNQAPGFQAIDRIYSVQELQSGKIARTFAETLLRSTFMLVHRLLRTELQEPITLRLADDWIQADPRQWQPRERVNIRTGLSPGERSRKAMAMSQVLAYQFQAIQGGLDGVLVDMPGLYNSLLDWCSANELDAGEKYFMNPQGQKAQQGAQGKLQQGQQQQQMQMQLAQIPLMVEQMKQQASQQSEAMQAQLDKYKADLDAKVKLQLGALSAEVEEAKLVGQATADLQLAEHAARNQSAGVGAGANGSGNGSSG